MKIALGSDHGGFDIKETIRKSLMTRGIEVEDVGCYNKDSVDYPDYAREVALRIVQKTVDEGILVCTTGIGMAMAANKFPRVRAALCLSPEMATKARSHNDANVLVLGGGLTSRDQAEAIVDEWLKESFSKEERHERRVRKIDEYSRLTSIEEDDPEMFEAFQDEMDRQQSTINLIASENYAGRAVRDAQSSEMMNKYAEGYPDKRWYKGCEYVDVAETLAISRAKEIFGSEHANVQPHSGTSANMAVYFSVLEPGDTILAMDLAHGGHLSHGHKSSFSGRLFTIESYGVNKDTETIDYDDLAARAREHKPKLIVAGASAYPRVLDFERFRQIADSVGACLMVDMAHIAGLVAGGCHPNPVPYADFVTSTTHKTLRGPRGGIILCRKAFAKNIDKQIFPGIQGGPCMHSIAAKAVCFHYVLQPGFKTYTEQIVGNANVMAEVLQAEGLRLVSGGTDTHLILVDLSSMNITGKDASDALAKTGITVNKNVIPFDEKSPFLTSGIRLGTPAVTTRGMKDAEMKTITAMIVDVLRNMDDEAVLKKVREQVRELTEQFPIP